MSAADGIRVVTFDAGGTLFTERVGRNEMYRRVLASHGWRGPDELLARWRHRLHDAMPEIDRGHFRYTDGWFTGYVARLLDALKLDADPEAVRAELSAEFALPESFEVFGDAADALEDLAERGLRLAVISNWSGALHAILAGLGLARHFEQVVVSAEVGHSKPDRGIFEVALRRLEVTADRALHVGDHPVNDLAGARRAGLSSLLVDRAIGRSEASHVVGSLAEVATRLGA